MYNNFAVGADQDRLEGQRPLSEWGHDVEIQPESGLGRQLMNLGIRIPNSVNREFLGAWEGATERMTLEEYHHRSVPIYDGVYVWWGRSLTAYAFVRGGGDGLPLPEVGEYVIPIATSRGLAVVEDPRIERVVDHWSNYSISTERHANVRMWLEMPTGWRPEGAADDETSTEEAERPLQVGDVVRIRSDYPQQKIPAAWREGVSTFRARVVDVDGGSQGSLLLSPLADRPDGFGRNPFTWSADAWERVEGEGEAESTGGGRTAAEWEERWNTFWREGAQRAQDRGYWRAFVELAEEFQVEVNAPYTVQGTLRLQVSPRLAGNSGRVTQALINSIILDALHLRNDRLREQEREDMVVDVSTVAFSRMERVDG